MPPKKPSEKASSRLEAQPEVATLTAESHELSEQLRARMARCEPGDRETATASVRAALALLRGAKKQPAATTLAIEGFRVALAAFDPERDVVDIAATQSLLGAALIALPDGEGREEAVIAYETALTVSRDTDDAWREAFPGNWAATQRALGNALSLLPTGDRATRLTRAVEAYREALDVFTLDRFPVERARTLNNLGAALLRLPAESPARDGHASHLAEAIDAYREALEVFTPDELPDEWARTQAQLGVALLAQTAGDRQTTLEEATEALRAAIEATPREKRPRLWARLRGRLGAALAQLAAIPKREGGEQALSEAVDAFRDAAGGVQRDRDPVAWARAHNDLGAALASLPSGDRVAHTREAIAALAGAVEALQDAKREREAQTVEANLARARETLAELQR